MSIPFEFSYFITGVSILNLLVVVAGLLLVFFDWGAAKRREILYLVSTDEKPGQRYFSAARRRRALYTRLLVAFGILAVHQFLTTNFFAALSEPNFQREYLAWWRETLDNVTHREAMATVLRMQFWWRLTDLLALIFVAFSLLYELRSRQRTTIDLLTMGLGCAWVLTAIYLVATHGQIMGALPMGNDVAGWKTYFSGWKEFGDEMGRFTLWARSLVMVIFALLLFGQSRAEREESSFGSGAVLAALGAWVMGGYVSSLPVPVDVETFTDRFIGTPAAQCLGWAVAILLIVPVIAKHVLAGYEAMERSRHRLGRERQVIIAFLQRIGVAFSTAPEQETVLGILLDSALETTEANAAAIYLFNAETQEYGPPVLRHFFPPLYVDTSSAYQEHHAGATEVLLAQAMQQRFALGQGVIGEVAKSGKPQLIEDVRQAGIVLGKTTQYFRDYSMLVTPLRVRDECQAVIAVLQKQRGSFNQVDQDLMQALADQGALVINHVRLLGEAREQERFKREMEIAHTIQQRLLPDKCPVIPGFDIGAFGTAATEVGGDYYDFFDVDDDHLGIVIADVSGKGVHAALIAAMMRSAFRMQARGNLDVKEVLQNVNEFIGKDLPPEMFITCIYGILEVSTRRFTWARAGHEPLILAHLDDTTDVLAPAGFAMGVLGSPDFDQLLEVESVLLQKGDRILLFTDGLTEAMNARGEEFGMARILRVLSHSDPATKPVTATLGGIAEPHFTESVHDPADLISMEMAVEHHVAGAPQSDDLTMVFLEAT